MDGNVTAQRAAYLALAFCWACWLVNFMSRFLVSISLPMVEAELAIPHALSGLLVTAVMIAYSASTIPAGLLSRRLGARRTIQLFLLLSLAAYAAIWLSRSYAAVLASMLLLGAAIGMYLPSAVALLTGWFAGRRLGAVLGVHETAVSAGKIFGAAIVGGLAATWGDWRISYLVLLPAVLGLVAWSSQMRESSAYARATARPDRGAPRAPQSTPRRDRRTLWYLLPFLTNMFLSFGAFTMLTVYLVSVFALDVGAASAVFAMVHIGGLVGVVAGGALSDRLGRVPTMLLLLAVSTACLLAVYFQPFGVPLVLLWATLNFTSTAYFPVTFAYLADVAAPRSPALLVGLYTGTGTLVGGAASTIIGALGDAFGLRVGMLFPAALGVAGVAVLLALRGVGDRRWGRGHGAAGYK